MFCFLFLYINYQQLPHISILQYPSWRYMPSNLDIQIKWKNVLSVDMHFLVNWKCNNINVALLSSCSFVDMKTLQTFFPPSINRGKIWKKCQNVLSVDTCLVRRHGFISILLGFMDLNCSYMLFKFRNMLFLIN